MGMEPIAMRRGELESWKQGRRVEVKTKILKHPSLVHGERQSVMCPITEVRIVDGQRKNKLQNSDILGVVEELS